MPGSLALSTPELVLIICLAISAGIILTIALLFARVMRRCRSMDEMLAVIEIEAQDARARAEEHAVSD